MLFRIATLLSVFRIFTLYAELGNEFPTVLASTEVDEGTIYNHCVNAISGAYFEVKADLVVRGPEPLVLYHAHVSSDIFNVAQGGQWRDFTDSITIQEGDSSQVYLHMADGASYVFSPTNRYWGFTYKDPNHSELRLNGLDRMTNTGQRSLSGRNHPKNLKLHYYQDSRSFVLINGAGEKKVFTLVNEMAFFKRYRLSYEIRANGNKVLYSYKRHSLSEIKAVDASPPF